MELHIAICDDSQADRALLERLVLRWAAGAGHGLLLRSFSNAEQLLFQSGEESFDILLLDIELGPAMDGVSLARELRRDNQTAQIVFITGYSDYLSEGYEVEALRYLMKPVKEDKLSAVLDRAAEKLQKDEKTLTLDSGGGTVRIPIWQIRYAGVFGNYVTVYGKEAYTAKMTLAQLEQRLDDRFYRVGRSVLVNLTQISRVTRAEIRLLDGTAIPLPRGAYEGVNRAIISMR